MGYAGRMNFCLKRFESEDLCDICRLKGKAVCFNINEHDSIMVLTRWLNTVISQRPRDVSVSRFGQRDVGSIPTVPPNNKESKQLAS